MSGTNSSAWRLGFQSPSCSAHLRNSTTLNPINFSSHSLIPLIKDTLFSTHYMPGHGVGAGDRLGVKPDASQSVGPGWREAGWSLEEDAQYTSGD